MKFNTNSETVILKNKTKIVGNMLQLIIVTFLQKKDDKATITAIKNEPNLNQIKNYIRSP